MHRILVSMIALAGTASAQPIQFRSSTVLGGPDTYVFDTVGSTAAQGGDVLADVDTELAIWDADGILLAENDDGPGGGFGTPSEITIFLDEGVYFLGISEFNSIFEDGFVNSGSNFEDGDIYDVVLNVNGIQIGAATIGFDSSINFESRTVFFRVEVVPAPASAGLLGLAGLVAARRRR